LMLIAVRITAGIRFSVTTSSEIKSTGGTFLGRLSKDNRKKFMSACVYTFISFLLGTSAVLFVINLISPLSIIEAISISIIGLLIIVHSLWNSYNRLAQGKEDVI
jgi:hypothetical protein